MNQNKQMLEVVQQVRREIQSLTALQNGTVNHIVKSACGTLDRVLQTLAAEPAPNTLGYVQGIEAAAKMLDTKADDYAGEFGFGDMGGLEFSRGAQREYHSTLIELAEEVRAMVGAEPAPLVRLTQTERDRIAMSCQSTQQVISATIDAMVAKNGGQHVSD